MLPEDLPPKAQSAIMDAVLSGAFKPLPYDESEEEAMPMQPNPGTSRLLTQDATDANDRDYPDWGKY